ncbi:Ig-like domain-containing protein [Litoribrevibacter albus]|uniref:SbsA Ig-like domain-containing protein n=1 Tax=Litoribrevibacter albus TaxID=1473156 RepID=A0AA37SDD6_9GAMM|nr:Ig-like domain-containing protein [Litoribrevibacter albus]GLQ33068.1 hypothetical protein GCM10007876_35470 [Litoribrevibacter albus]
MPFIQYSGDTNRWRFRTCLIALATTGLTACGGGSSSGSDIQSDQSTPEVSLVSPANNATDVDTSTIPSATFNEDMLGTSIDTSTITLESSGTPVDISVIFDGATNQVSLQPTIGLGPLQTYTATIKQPVADLSGNTLANEYSWSFTTEDGSWQAPTSLSGEAEAIYIPMISANSRGQKLAIWLARNDGEGDLWASMYDVNTGWSQPEQVDDSAGNSGSANIVLTDDGDALAVWYQTDGSYYTIWTNHYDADTGWQGPQAIPTTYEDHASSPELVMDTQGNAIATWRQRYENRQRIAAARYDSENGWGAVTIIDNNMSEHGYEPKIDMDQEGNAIVVWHGFDGTRNNIYSNRYVVDNGWIDPIIINAPGSNAYAPQVSVNTAGEAMAVWYQDDLDGLSRDMIWAARYTPENAWLPAETISENENNSSVDYPIISVDNQGNALVIWTQYRDSEGDVWSRYYQANNGWQTPTQLENITGNAYGSSLSMDNNGNAMAMWIYDNEDVTEIMASRFTREHGWQEAINIDSDELGSSKQPIIKLDTQGVGTAIWAQSDAKIWSAQFK